ncbi:hypothetical protein ECK5_51360 [Escherichia coli O10:K5(L):H4 str. ATCC 23506]|nr:hypothetical protein [Escherichia coli]CCP98827.1 hypothetical protein ECK5_51360 [Escherichia coli O10:K5(L):H4 str. ATCC 23506]
MSLSVVGMMGVEWIVGARYYQLKQMNLNHIVIISKEHGHKLDLIQQVDIIF